MYADDDPYLSDVRRVCLALPEAVEVESWGRPPFRAGAQGKMFAVFGGEGLLFKSDGEEERAALLADPRFSVPAYYGPSGWLALALADDTDWGEVAELVESSYRQVALKRLIKALEAS